MATSVKGAVGSGPRGRAETVDAVLDAAEQLFARSGPTAVSLRDIAAEAGVTYSLINRHFGTKDVLIDLLLQRYAERWRQRVEGVDDYGTAINELVGPGPDAALYHRLLGWALLSSGDEAGKSAHVRHAVLDQLTSWRPQRDTDHDVASADSDVVPDVAAADPAVGTALDLALIFGWRFFGTYLRGALHLTDEQVAATHEAVREQVTRGG